MPPSSETPSETAGGGRATRGDLLLVDNDAKIVELLSWFLGNQGFTVRVAASFVEAREQLAERRPDLLISDVDLGVESATIELPRLSAEGLLPPTLVVSGYLDGDTRRSIFLVPEVLDSLPKPFEFPDLEAKVVACLAGETRRSVEDIPVAAPFRVADVPADVPAQGLSQGLPQSLPQGLASGDDDEDDDGWIEISPGG